MPLLRLGGLHVTADATALRWAGETVVVDAPCSGIHMAWAGLFLTAVLACRENLDRTASARLFRRAGAVVFAANVIRAAALFCLESGLWPTAAWAHETVGLALFGAAALAILALSRRTHTRHKAPPPLSA